MPWKWQVKFDYAEMWQRFWIMNFFLNLLCSSNTPVWIFCRHFLSSASPLLIKKEDEDEEDQGKWFGVNQRLSVTAGRLVWIRWPISRSSTDRLRRPIRQWSHFKFNAAWLSNTPPPACGYQRLSAHNRKSSSAVSLMQSTAAISDPV